MWREDFKDWCVDHITELMIGVAITESFATGVILGLLAGKVDS